MEIGREELREFIRQVVCETVEQLGLVKKTKSVTILDYYKQWIDGFERQVKAGMKAASTLRKHRRVWHLLREYLIYNKVEDMVMADAGKDFLTNLQIYLKTEKGLSTGSIRVYLSPVIMLFRHAYDEGLTGSYLFRDFRFEHEDNDRGYLSGGDVQKIASHECKDDKERRVRDLFIFCCYTGLAFIDLKEMRQGHVTTNPKDGSLWIQKPRRKTGVEETVRLLPLPLRILNTYRLTADKDKVFDVPNYKTCNRIISRMAKDCGIGRHVTWHIARHTMATSVCLSNGVTMETVSRILGHRSLRSTQIYAKVTKEKLGSELDILETRLQ